MSALTSSSSSSSSMPFLVSPILLRRKRCSRGFSSQKFLLTCLIILSHCLITFAAVNENSGENDSSVKVTVGGSHQNSAQRALIDLVESEGTDFEESITLTYIEAFAHLLPRLSWPVNESTSQISATFGPVYPYKFHTGIDIRTNEFEPVHAMYDGVVLRKEIYRSAGLTLVLRHKFDDHTRVQLHPDKKTTRTWYTFYSKLSETVDDLKEGDTVTTGQKIAIMGEITTKRPELHFGVSVGTSCSLSYAVRNPTSKCNSFEYDPNVHPLLTRPPILHPASSNTTMQEIEIQKALHTEPVLSIRHTQHPTKSKPTIYTVSTPPESPSVNYYSLNFISASSPNFTPQKSHTFDLNLRTSFDASSKDALDEVDESKPYLSPRPYYGNGVEWEMDLIVPISWLTDSTLPFPYQAGDILSLTVGDIWNRTATLNTICPELKEENLGFAGQSPPPPIENKSVAIQPAPTTEELTIEAVFPVPISCLKSVRDEYALSAGKRAATAVLEPGVLELPNEAKLVTVKSTVADNSTCEPCHSNDRCIIVDVTSIISYSKAPSNTADMAKLLSNLHTEFERHIYEKVHISSALATNCYAGKERQTSAVITIKLTFSSEEASDMDDDAKFHFEETMNMFFNEQLNQGSGPKLINVNSVSLIADEEDDNSQARRRTSVIDIIDQNNDGAVVALRGRNLENSMTEMNLKMLVRGDYFGPPPDFTGQLQNSISSNEDKLVGDLQECSNQQDRGACGYFSNLENIKDATPPKKKDNTDGTRTRNTPKSEEAPIKKGHFVAVIGVTVLLVGFICLAIAGLIHRKRRKEVIEDYEDAQSFPSYCDIGPDGSKVSKGSGEGKKKRGISIFASNVRSSQRLPGGFCLGTNNDDTIPKSVDAPKRKKEKLFNPLSEEVKKDSGTAHAKSNASQSNTGSSNDGNVKNKNEGEVGSNHDDDVGSNGGNDWLGDLGENKSGTSFDDRSGSVLDGEFFQLGLDGTIKRRNSTGMEWLDVE